MRVFIDTNVLVDAAADPSDVYPNRLLKDLIETADHSLWTSAISIINMYQAVLTARDKENAKNILNLIKEHVSIIAFRNSTFLKTVERENIDFEIQIQIASAEEFHMDCIITRNVGDFENSRIPVLTPAQFLEKWDAGEFEVVNNVPFLDLEAQHHQIYNKIDDRITDIIINTAFVLGRHVEEFEEGFAEIQGAKYCIGVSSGTDALHIALMALGIGQGDAVIVPVNTFIATAEAGSLCGAEPVFVDCDEYHNVDVNKLEDLLRKRTTGNGQRATAIIPVHLYGQSANIAEIMALAEEYDLKVVEDCCQAHLAGYEGKLVGNFGQFGAFSFYPGKNLGAYGEAGALITNDETLYQKAKMIRQHGEVKRYYHQVIGHNYRMEAIQGAVLSVKLKYLTEWTEKRRTNARLYNELLTDVEAIQTPLEQDNCYSVYHLYVIQTDDRDGLQEYLQENDIGTGLHYPVPLHLQPAYASLGYKEGDFPVAEAAAKRILSLPMYPELTEGQLRYVCDKIKEYY